MANWPALKTELDTDPDSRGYSTMNDQQAADSLNIRDILGPTNLSALDIALDAGGTIAKSFMIALASGDELAKVVLGNFKNGIGLDLSRTEVRDMIDQLTGLTPPQRITLKGLASDKQSRGESFGFTRVTAAHVARVRSWT